MTVVNVVENAQRECRWRLNPLILDPRARHSYDADHFEAEGNAMVASKISETLLRFAEPLIETLDSPPKREQLEQALTVAVTVWNGVLLDDHEAGDYVAESRRSIEMVSLPGQLALFDALVERRRALFGQDRRLVGEFKLVDDPSGEVRLRAEAYALPSDTTR